MASEPAFIEAGKVAGLELWRIDALTPIKQSFSNGQFHSKYSYIVLSTSKYKSGSFRWNIHFWLGNATTQDEASIAAFKTMELNDCLNGCSTIYREVQGSESPLFLSYFKNLGGMEYVGTIKDYGKVHTESSYGTRLLQLTGRRTTRVIEVPLSSSSLNNWDVFILDTGLKIFIFSGNNTSKIEKAKGMDTASMINMDSHEGIAEIIIVNDDIKCEEFWKHLGGYVNVALISEDNRHIDEKFISEKEEIQKKLFSIQISEGVLDFIEIPVIDGKITKGLLLSEEFYLAFDEKIYIWVGKSKFC